MGSDGKEEFGFSMNYKTSGSPPSSNWQSAVANAAMNNVQESSLRVPTSSESLSSSFFQSKLGTPYRAEHSFPVIIESHGVPISACH